MNNKAFQITSSLQNCKSATLHNKNYFSIQKVLKFDFTYSIFRPEFRWKNLKIRSLLFNWLEKQTALEFFNDAHQNSVRQFGLL